MSELRVETWDDGRLLVNAAFSDRLRRLHLTTFTAVEALPLQDVVRRVKRRVTARLVLGDGAATTTAYLKTHDGYPLSEIIKPLLRFSRPVLGARAEWEAMRRFHALGIRTMTPILFGQSGRRSFVMTEALEEHERADLWLNDRLQEPENVMRPAVSALSDAVADMARTMHAAGLHHQDFYLCHFLIPQGASADQVRVIDLGRVRSHRRLARRWVTKDLAQLHFSAEALNCRDRVRFLKRYLGRPLRRADRRLLRAVEIRRSLIARHTAKHRL